METIIVPVDFSEISKNAAFYAADFAKAIHADIILMHVLPIPVVIADVPIPFDSHEIALSEAKTFMAQLKDELLERTNDKIGITTRIATGSFLNETRVLVNEHYPFAIIMGTKGSGATEAFFIGSYTLEVVNHIDAPLIIVPPGARFENIDKVGLAYDMKNTPEIVPLKDIQHLFKHFKPSFEVLYVSHPKESLYPKILAESRFAQIHLAEFDPEIRIATDTDVSDGLSKFVQEHDIDLLLIMPRQHNFLERIFRKSVSKEIALHPVIPVMLLHQ